MARRNTHSKPLRLSLPTTTSPLHYSLQRNTESPPLSPADMIPYSPPSTPTTPTYNYHGLFHTNPNTPQKPKATFALSGKMSSIHATPPRPKTQHAPTKKMHPYPQPTFLSSRSKPGNLTKPPRGPPGQNQNQVKMKMTSFTSAPGVTPSGVMRPMTHGGQGAVPYRSGESFEDQESTLLPRRANRRRSKSEVPDLPDLTPPTHPRPTTTAHPTRTLPISHETPTHAPISTRPITHPHPQHLTTPTPHENSHYSPTMHGTHNRSRSRPTTPSERIPTHTTQKHTHTVKVRHVRTHSCESGKSSGSDIEPVSESERECGSVNVSCEDASLFTLVSQKGKEKQSPSAPPLAPTHPPDAPLSSPLFRNPTSTTHTTPPLSPTTLPTPTPPTPQPTSLSLPRPKRLVLGSEPPPHAHTLTDRECVPLCDSVPLSPLVGRRPRTSTGLMHSGNSNSKGLNALSMMTQSLNGPLVSSGGGKAAAVEKAEQHAMQARLEAERARAETALKKLQAAESSLHSEKERRRRLEEKCTQLETRLALRPTPAPTPAPHPEDSICQREGHVKEISRLQKELSRCQESNHTLTTQLKQRTEDLAIHRSQTSDAQSQLSTLQHTTREKAKEITRLQTQLREAEQARQREVNELKGKLTEMKRQVARSEALAEPKPAPSLHEHPEFQRLRTDFDRQCKETIRLQHLSETQARELQSAKKALGTAEGRIAALQRQQGEEMETQRGEAEAQRERADDLQHQLTTLRNVHDQVQREFEAIQEGPPRCDCHKMIEAQARQHQEEIGHLRNEVLRLKEKIRETQSQARHAQTHTQPTQTTPQPSRNESSRGELSVLRREKQDLVQRLEGLEAQYAQKESLSISLFQKLTEAEDRIEQLKQSQNAAHTLRELEEALRRKERDQEIFEQLLEAKAEEIAHLQAELSKTQILMQEKLAMAALTGTQTELTETFEEALRHEMRLMREGYEKKLRKALIENEQLKLRNSKRMNEMQEFFKSAKKRLEIKLSRLTAKCIQLETHVLAIEANGPRAAEIQAQLDQAAAYLPNHVPSPKIPRGGSQGKSSSSSSSSPSPFLLSYREL